MKKLTSIAMGAILLLAGSASAATISDPLFSNGQTTIDATGGSTVNGTFTLTVGAGEVVEWLRTTPDTQPFTDTSVGGQLGYQEGVYTNVPFSAKAPPNTGTYNVNEQGAGTFGGNRSINGGDNVVVWSTSLGMVRVVATGGTGSVGGFTLEGLMTQIAALQAHIACTASGGTFANNVCTPKPASTTVDVCAKLESYDFEKGDTGRSVRKAQLFIMQNGGDIQAGATGYWGNQSAGALEDALEENDCI